MSNLFKFKEFNICQEKSAMKVGTDGVLFGAWASIENNPYSILDIGTGTGLIALQLAQRCNATLIDAIEIDDQAYEEAVGNFENSKWSNRLFCYHTSLKEFTSEIENKYDLIVSNPPFYTEDYKSNNNSRNNARFVSSLPFKELIKSVVKLLSLDGVFSVIIPFKEELNFLSITIENNLYINKITHVKGNLESEIKRSLLQFSFFEKEIEYSDITIETLRHKYTKEYINLVKKFYLKM